MNHNTRGAQAAQLNSAQLPRHQLILFELRCQTLVHRVRCNQLQFIDAVDMAYQAAVWSGLVDVAGDDLVQATMARAFMQVPRP
jgi:hypothetical protein